MGLTSADVDRAARRAALLAALGDPQRGLAVVQVAGTNGKGSTAALLAEILRATGLPTGRFTSPDLAGPHERFWLDGTTIAPAELARREAALAPAFAAAEAAWPHLGPLGPFERWCAIAWTWLAERGARISVVEAGVGGLTDATNVFDRPLLTLVSAIGVDHVDRLGTDVAAIARHKAGLFRPGTPALTTATGVARDVLAAEAARVGAPFAAIAPLAGAPGPDAPWTVHLADGPALLALPGTYQLENAALAVAGAEALAVAGLPVTREAIRTGLANATWPGRLERLSDPTGGAWLLDGAHNADAAAALVGTWEPPAAVVVGFRADKEAASMVRLLTAGGRPLVVTPVPGVASWGAADLAAAAAGPVLEAADLDAALAIARQIAPAGLRAITGSLWLVGAARSRLTAPAHPPTELPGAA